MEAQENLSEMSMKVASWFLTFAYPNLRPAFALANLWVDGQGLSLRVESLILELSMAS